VPSATVEIVPRVGAWDARCCGTETYRNDLLHDPTSERTASVFRRRVSECDIKINGTTAIAIATIMNGMLTMRRATG
jgi:hypothetical protein